MSETKKKNAPKLTFHPVTGETLPDLAQFSEEHGKFGWCSCMRWRMKSTEFKGSSKKKRVERLEEMVCEKVPVGVLAYSEGEPIGWCSIAPRETYEALERYRALPRIDEKPVWSVVCFFIDSGMRRQGVTLGLLKAAVKYAKSQGASIIEGYPVEPGERSYTYMGSPSTFRRAGFHDVTPDGTTRIVMRHVVRKRKG